MIQKSREKAIHAGLRVTPEMQFAQEMRHPLVDELHSIENKSDIPAQEIVDTFFKKRRNTIVL
jgi:hypothetical protein